MVRRSMSSSAATLRGADAAIAVANVGSRQQLVGGHDRGDQTPAQTFGCVHAPTGQQHLAGDVRRQQAGQPHAPASGRMPSAGSGSQNWAWSAATIRSAAIAISKPPPTAMPLTAAMTGVERSGSSRKPPNPPTP